MANFQPTIFFLWLLFALDFEQHGRRQVEKIAKEKYTLEIKIKPMLFRCSSQLNLQMGKQINMEKLTKTN